ncbi:MAG: acetyltransferase [Candidatus Bathyarchaeia archaeon]|jgi:sugar O-acyltransferase (sialic acid O-acetyltransferase NeuD family)
MAANKTPLIIIGDGETAEIAYEYFTQDTNFEVVAFSAERHFMKNKTLYGLPVVPFEELEKAFNPDDFQVFVAVSFTELNHVRARLLETARLKGYRPCSYISPKAFIGKNVKIGENCFIFENVVIQRAAKICDNVTIWTGSSIAHHSVVGANCFIASQVAVSGFCCIGENCFLGVNSCVIDRVHIGKNTVIGAGTVVVADTEPGKIYVGNPARPLPNKNTESLILNKV